MSPSSKAVYTYQSTDTTLKILVNQPIPQGTPPAGIYAQQPEFMSTLTLTKIDGGFIDDDRSIIYIRAKDFPKKPYTIYIIDGKTYRQHIAITDGYGLVKRTPKANNALQKKLKTLNKDHCKIEILRGFAAYKMLGIKMVHGVIIIDTTP
ncbi:hypothetical protein [Hymenobacter cellulosivorans]|uniref:Uncharacterized protein n=1 Tax=Hymenobacter cellulosivorans TaxID=2932249 RepID=A0ABY4F994_9BACT|nr:hypothetical protein [Hymenobacter cellulosivorans]UOQ52514.1 hypothetical protein MUN80_22530 [Hymenobacter cellulosivorans]